MTLWQYAAYCEAYGDQVKDQLCVQVQAAYYGAYWNSGAKHKLSLEHVLNKIRGHGQKHTKPVSIDKARKEFEQMEALRTNGWTQCN